MIGGPGRDQILFTGALGGVVVDLGEGVADGITEGHDDLSSISMVFGSPFDDRISGNSGANILLGCGGSDVLFGGEGGDLLSGEPQLLPVDWCPGVPGVDVAVGGSGFDRCIAEVALECETE